MNIIYEDNHIIVVIKKADQPVMLDSSNDYDLLTEIKDYIKIKYNKPGNVYTGLVHRLDRPVGGVMVFAKTSKAASRLSNSIRNIEFDKKYYAVVKGIINPLEATIENWMCKDDQEKKSYICNEDTPNAKLAKLKYKVVKSVSDMSLLDIELFTGRHHQIRVQLSSAGYPIYGDMRYGDGPKGHIALFAYSLGFIHPVTQKPMVFECDPDYTIPPWPLFK
ncbi:MAG: RluA family pseudouridine synthase [Clostridia bacterium]|jgi:23S rRNA pseudouridine1911/1915/1917 synthase|nr:RluA family pseudouridine synthase [Clostridia bacterium]NLF35669.1 RluA family pseudouridine synthase [Clostridiaceae bacterium]